MESSPVAKTYERLIIAIGAAILLPQLAAWRSDDVVQYLAYLLLAVLASALSVGYQTEQGLVPLSTLFILISLKTLSSPEAFLLAAATALAATWGTHKGQPHWRSDATLNVAAISIAVGLADVASRGVALPGQRRELSDAVQAILAGTTFFVGLSIPLATRDALMHGRKVGRVWKESYFWMLPYFVAGGLLASLFSMARDQIGWQLPVLALPISYLLWRAYRLYTERLEDGLRHAEEMASLHLRTIEALALAIDAKDETTHEHLQRVQIYAIEIGREMGLEKTELAALRAASLLHDIGKLAVPEHIISKPGRLTPEEFEKMKIHPVVGSEILERVRFPYPVAPMVRSHHERWDGAGYPDQLRSDEIPVGARILAAVDCFDALASDRQYRRALPIDKAIAIVLQDAGTAFDPRVVEILARRYRELEALAQEAARDQPKINRVVHVDATNAAPAAGYEKSAPAPVVRKDGGGEEPSDFLALIAAARQEAQAMFELVQSLGSSLSLDETLSVLSVRLKRIVPFDAMAVYIRRDGELKPEFVAGDNFRLFSSLRIPIGQGLSGWVAENAKPIVNGNPSVEPGYLNDPSKFSTLGAALAVPLSGLNGVVGVLTLYHTDRDAFTRDHLRILLVVSSKLSLSIENALRYRQAETTAVTDFLTELPNARSLFLHLDAELARCKADAKPLTVIVCDVDNFKQINDQYGHIEGNRLLKILAAAFRGYCRENDYVARMGGDEFVLIMSGLDQDRAQQRLNQIQRAVVDEVNVQAGLNMTISAGSAVFPAQGTTADDLLAAADLVMYKAKQNSASRLRAQRDWKLREQSQGPSAVQ
jgi:diguanylate cyclase (GGDEF)-like protein/putative nucleotidyltransferase with HDIG domain